MAIKIVLFSFGLALAGIAGYFVGFIDKQESMVECTITRVVRSESQEPLATGDQKIPYTVVSYSPRWRVFILPGVAGEDGQVIQVSPQLLK